MRPHRRWLHSQCVAYKSEETETSEGSLHSWDLVGYVELMSNEYCRPKLADLVGYVELMSNKLKCYVTTYQLAHGLHLFASYSFQCVAAALVVVYSTYNSSRSISIEAGRLLSASRSCRAMGLWSVSVAPCVVAWQTCHVTGQRPGHRHVIPLAAPPCMGRHRRFAAPGK